MSPHLDHRCDLAGGETRLPEGPVALAKTKKAHQKANKKAHQKAKKKAHQKAKMAIRCQKTRGSSPNSNARPLHLPMPTN